VKKKEEGLERLFKRGIPTLRREKILSAANDLPFSILRVGLIRRDPFSAKCVTVRVTVKQFPDSTGNA